MGTRTLIPTPTYSSSQAKAATMSDSAARFMLSSFLLPLLLLSACTSSTFSHGLSYSPTAAIQLVQYPLTGDTQPVHDPSMIRQGDTYYSFTSDPAASNGPALPIRCSKDRVTWIACGGVFQQMPAWLRAKVPGVGCIWAPDISYFNNVYHVYYAGSTTGSQRSAIGVATNTTMDPLDPAYRWVDRGEVIASNPGDDFNAIDPNILADTDATVWMTYGSYWTGIKQVQIDPSTGQILAETPRYDLASRPDTPDDPEEGASLIHQGKFYYLFVSVDHCCNPDLSTDDYKEAVGRATSPHGPFLDEAGTPMLLGGGTVLLQNNGTWNAPGGGTVFVDPVTSEPTLIFHALNMQQNGATHLWVKKIAWENGWPVLKPVLND